MLLLRFTTAALLLLSLLVGPLFAQTKGKNKKKNADEPVPAAGDEADEPVEGADIPRVIPVFDPGSHTQSICAMGFSSDKKKLITVGEDSSIQVWSTSTGERLDILRLPAYGHEQVSNVNAWHTAAISADGRYVAIGGGVRRSLSEGNQSARAKLMVVDIEKRTVQHIRCPQGEVTALAIAPDYRLAAAFNGKASDIVIYPVITEGEVKRRESTILKTEGAKDSATLLKFSPDGKQLLASHVRHEVVLWDLTGEQPSIKKKFEAGDADTATVAWAPNLQQFARSRVPERGFEIRSAAGELVREFDFAMLAGFHKITDLRFISYLNPQTLLVCSSDAKGRADPGSFVYHFDLTSGQGKLIYQEPSAGLFHATGAISTDGELGAITVSMGLDAVVYRVKDGSLVARCGAASPVPTLVGWAEKDRPAGFAWSEERHARKFNTTPQDLQFGFDLALMEPIAEIRAENYGVMRNSIGDWNIRTTAVNQFSVNRGEAKVGSIQGGNGILARTLIPRGDDPPLAIWAANRARTANSTLSLSKSDGTTVTSLSPAAIFIRDVAPSPDGRFAIVSTGTHQLNIYSTDGLQSFPLLSFARVNGEWVLWSREGYFAASPGGEKLFGWAVSNGPNKLSTFHPAEKFSKHFHRPDLLKLAIQLGSIEAALKQQVETRAPAVEGLLPPKGELKLVKQTGNQVQVQATATPGAPDKPIVAMRLLLNGRPFGTNTQKLVAKGEKAEAIWNIEFPADTHELKLLVRGEDNSAVSDPLVLTGPKSESQVPVLHRLCIGVDQYALPALNLTSAAKDATDVYGALEKHCVGEANRFGRVNGALLTNGQATSPAVLKAINDIRKVAKPGDLMVMLFAGHGIQQAEVVKLDDGTIVQKQEYYLMTHEADPGQSLKDKSLSGTQLRQALGAVGCPVLLVMDSCHSASGVRAFRPATDGLARGLTDDSTGVTILAAAMSTEVASATAENGYFTAAFLKALEVGKDVPYDPRDHVLYTHHIYSVVFSEVRYATKGKQNPFLNMPWTVPPLALREVPATK
jgi:WD40 repeat protein